jgi:serine/threonine protein kinase
MSGSGRRTSIDAFSFQDGEIIAGKYTVIQRMGLGWEGEVYQLQERTTGIELAGKFFYPQRNRRNRAVKIQARKLHKLRDCPIVIQYFTQERCEVEGIPVHFLVSELVEGVVLRDFVRNQRGRRLNVLAALHLLHALAVGFESIHQCGEYHGDLHWENVIVRRHGLGFDLKLIDLYSHGKTTRFNIQCDVVDMIRIFYDALGGPKTYAKHPPEVKSICCGLKRSLILSKFPSAAKLRAYLENLEWETA